MSPVDKMMAWAQIALSAIFLVLTFVVILLYETGHVHLNADQMRSFENLLQWLTGAALLILIFWFQRQRQGGIPDAPMITQTHTAADGSKLSITSPAHLPLPEIANPIRPVTPASSMETSK